MRTKYSPNLPQHFLKKYPLLLLFIFSTAFFNAQVNYVFTTCGQTGQTGPTQGMVNTAYASTNLNGSVTVVGQGVQQWVVPATGLYRIKAVGASGGSINYGCTAQGGNGASMQGEFNFTAGQVLLILVGQRGLTNTEDGGGGGGSFVTTSASVALVVAGGGGGASDNIRNCGSNLNGINASTTTAGTAEAGGIGAGGTNGNGGNNPGGGSGGAGGGFLTNGAGGGLPGLSFMNGAIGATGYNNNHGGYGGGGCGWHTGGNGGGGGGYSGGGSNGASPFAGGGGGGSYNAGTNQTNSISATPGDGTVTITKLCPLTISVTGVNSSSAMCAGSSVTLTTDGISNYLWSDGSTTSSIIVSPTSTTIYSLTATSYSLCTASAAITVAVNSAVPSLTVTNTANSGGICPTKTVNLNATGAITYTWTGGSPTVTNGVTFSPTAAHNYTVTGTNGCGTSSAVTSVSVHPFPTMNTTVSSPTLCSGNSLTLTATGTGTSYVWSGAATTITNGVGFVPTTTSTFVVIGTSALSCTALASVPVTVYITPTLAPVASPSMVCIGGSSTLSAVGALNYTWTSATQTVNTNTLLVTPNLGLSSYTVTKSNSNCSHTSVISITTNSLPTIAAFANPATACALSPVTLAAGGAQTYTWTAPGTPNYTFTGSSNVISAPVSTTYSVAASDGTCVNVATVLLNIDPNPTISISVNSSSICNGQQVTLTASGGNSYTWTAGSTTLTGPSITQSPTGPVSYVVTGDNNFGCTSQTSQVILVYNSPTITVSANKSLICSGDPVTFNAAGASTYTWDASAGGLTSSSVTVNPTNSSSGFVTYTVQGTNPQGCVGSKAAQVNIYVPVLSVSGTTNACKGDAISLTANGGNGGSYNWNTSSGSPVSSQVISVPVTAPAVYTLSANSTSLNISCPASRTVAVGLYPDANIVATAQRTTICNNESVELYASGGVSYSWNTTATGGTIVVKPLIQTTYTVTGIDNNGCKGTGTVQVKMSGCVGIAERNADRSELTVYPNPNNGEFTIQSSSAITLLLVNELGQLVQKIELSEGNNHTMQVKNLSQGIYFMTGQNGTTQIHQKIVIAK